MFTIGLNSSNSELIPAAAFLTQISTVSAAKGIAGDRALLCRLPTHSLQVRTLLRLSKAADAPSALQSMAVMWPPLDRIP